MKTNEADVPAGLSSEEADAETETAPARGEIPAASSDKTVDAALVLRVLKCVRKVINDPELFAGIVGAVQNELGIADKSLLEP